MQERAPSFYKASAKSVIKVELGGGGNGVVLGRARTRRGQDDEAKKSRLRTTRPRGLEEAFGKNEPIERAP